MSSSPRMLAKNENGVSRRKENVPAPRMRMRKKRRERWREEGHGKERGYLP
jgi:hypothetical protein